MELDIEPKNVIENSNGELRAVSGPEAMQAFRLRTLLVGLRFEQKTGMKMTRGPGCKKLAQEETGLKTRDFGILETALSKKLDDQIDKCLIVTDGV